MSTNPHLCRAAPIDTFIGHPKHFRGFLVNEKNPFLSANMCGCAQPSVDHLTLELRACLRITLCFGNKPFFLLYTTSFLSKV